MPEAIISRPPWKSWHMSRVPCSLTAALIRSPHGHDLGQVAADGVRRQEARGVDGRRLDDDQPRAAGGPGAVVGDQVVGRQMVMHERRLVRRRDDAVLDRDRPELERGEEAVQHPDPMLMP